VVPLEGGLVVEGLEMGRATRHAKVYDAFDFSRIVEPVASIWVKLTANGIGRKEVSEREHAETGKRVSEKGTAIDFFDVVGE